MCPVSFPDLVVGNFHLQYLSGSSIVLGFSKPLTEISSMNISWDNCGQCVGLTNLTTFIWRLSCSIRVPKFLEPSGPVQA